MKAIVLASAGGTDQLSIKDIPIPAVKEGEVLVKVRSFAINPVDIKTRNGKAQYNLLKENPPVILGWDIAGEVTEVGKGSTKFKVGDEVFGMVNFPGLGHAYAEFVTAPETHLCLKPAILPFEDAAAASLAALTAWQVIAYQLKISKGEKILVHSAAGGVGHFVVQFAKYFGAYVIGTASPENHSYLKSIGADETLDYKQPDFLKSIQLMDAVFDPLGGEITKQSYAVLKDGGKIVSIVGGVKEEDAALYKPKNVIAANYLVHSSGEDLEKIKDIIVKGKLKVHVSHVFPFAKISEAHQQSETGKTKGKIVVNIR